MNGEQRSYMRFGVVLSLVAGLAACKDRGKESAARANEDTTALAQLVATDVSEIERGLPLGAVKFAPLFAQGASDELKDPNVLKKQLIATRRQIPELVVAKSTFFALADDKGVALRNDLETDVMAGTDLVSIFPALAPALQPGGGHFVETSGGFPQTKKNNDRDWLAAAPVKRADGSVGGLYLTGWTYRTFARHLLESRKHDITEELRTAGKNGQMPIEYIGVFDQDGVYMAPLTPPVDEQALTGLKLADLTANGQASGTLTLTGRDFGWSAIRTPKLGPQAGVVVLRSEL